MEDEPLVSVIVPTYNRPHYLASALESALGQTLRSLEVIVQDNASDGDPRGIVLSLGDPRVRFFRNERTLSQVGNVVSACHKARGRYFAILGDDDLWEPEFLAALVAPLERDPELVVAFCDHGIIDSDGRPDRATADRVSRTFGRAGLAGGTYRSFEDIALVRRAICTFSVAVFRRAEIDFDAIPLELGFGPIDHYITYLAVRSGKGCHYVAQRLAHYRYHAEALGSSLADPARRIENARYAMLFWDRAARDDRLRRRRYFEMKRGFNALVICVGHVRLHRARDAWGELRRALWTGLIRPRIFLDYCIYALRLRRVGA